MPREYAAMSLDDDARGAVEIAGTSVVAEPAPERKHVVLVGGRQAGDVGEAGKEALEIRDDRGDLCLLQHDFGEPDRIGIARALPRQIVASMLALPGNDALGELAHPGIVAQNSFFSFSLSLSSGRDGGDPPPVAGAASPAGFVASCSLDLIWSLSLPLSSSFLASTCCLALSENAEPNSSLYLSAVDGPEARTGSVSPRVSARSFPPWPVLVATAVAFAR